MHEVVLVAGWDILLLAVPCFGMSLLGFSRLSQLISTVKNEERNACSEFEHPVWEVGESNHSC